MRENLYKTYFLDSNRWFKKSREHLIAAFHIITFYEDIYKTGKNVVNSKHLNFHPFEAWSSVLSAANLQFGLSLENLLKGYLIKQGKIQYVTKPKGLVGNHNLVKMLDMTGYQYSDKEKINLQLLTYELQTLSKYHIAKNLEKQKEFKGIINNPINNFRFIKNIVEKLLDEKSKKNTLN